MTDTLTSRAAPLDLTIEQGSTFDFTMTWKDKDGVVIDLTSYSPARMKIKKDLDGTLIDDESGGIGITLGGVAGTIAVLISATNTAAYVAEDFTNAVYDLEMVDGTTVRRLLKGSVSLDAEVTD